jgi:hypothetical protein
LPLEQQLTSTATYSNHEKLVIIKASSTVNFNFFLFSQGEIYLLVAVLSVTFASEAFESEPEYQQIAASQQNFYQDLLNMSPSERERLGLNLNRDGQMAGFESMPMSMNNPWTDYMMGMGGGYHSMGYNMMYPGFNQMQMNYMNSGCGCQQVCPPCYLPW